MTGASKEPSAVDRSARVAAFMHWFGISGAQASVLWLLFTAKGAYRTAAQLAAVESTTPDAMLMRITRLRQAMDCEAVDSAQACGYRLTDIGLGECQTALREFGASLLGRAVA